MPTLNCLVQGLQDRIPQAFKGGAKLPLLPFKRPTELLSDRTDLPSWRSPSKQSAKAYQGLADSFNKPWSLPNPNRPQLGNEDYPQRPGIPNKFKDIGWSYAQYEVDIVASNGVEGTDSWKVTIVEYGPVYGVGRVYYDPEDSTVWHYGLIMGRGNPDTYNVRYGFTQNPESHNKETVVVLDVRLPQGRERDPRKPSQLPLNTPLRPSPSQAIPSPLGFLPQITPQKPLLPMPQIVPQQQPQEQESSPIPLLNPIKYPSLRPKPYPQTNPAQKPERPLLPFPVPSPSPYLPSTPTAPVTTPSTTPATSTSGAPSVSIPSIPTGLQTPQNRPSLENGTNVIPQKEPCKCNGLQENEDYVIAKPQKIQVPIVTEVAGKAVTKPKTITIIAIKGVSEASHVIQQYEVEAAQRRAQIAAKNQQNFIQGQVTANNVGIATLNGIAVMTQTAVNGLVATLNVVQTVANTTLTAVNAIANNSFVQKAIMVMNLVFAIHNAMMLSRNVAETVVDTVQLVARALGFKLTKVDENGNEVEVQLWDAVSGTVNSIVQSVIGANNLAAIQVRLGALNRIYHAASSVIDSTMDYFNTTWRLAEITVGNIGKIGNALRSSGQVFENAYETMEETFWGNRQQRFGRLTKALENIEEGADIAASVASTKISVGQAKEEIQEELDALDEMLQNNKQTTDSAIQQKIEDSRVETELGDINIGNL